MSTDFLTIVLLSTLAGLGTGLGGLVVLVRKPGERLFVFLIGLAAGIMIMMSLFLVVFPGLMPFSLSFAAGVMVFITVDELIPIAHEHGHEHFTSFGIIAGFILAFGLLAAIR